MNADVGHLRRVGDHLLGVLVAPLYVRLLISEEPLDGELADQVSVAALAAARDGAFSRASRR